MADIFVSYARQDRVIVEPFVAMLEAQGWSVWWDHSIGPGSSFSRVIEQEIAKAKCLIVLWSKNSISSDWVNAEASEGFARKILIPVNIEDVCVPLIFRQTQASDLVGWPQTVNQHEIDGLMAAISRTIEKPIINTLPQHVRSRYPGFMAAFAALVAMLALSASWFLLLDTSDVSLGERISYPDKVSDQYGSRIVTLSVLPFDGVEPDISIEVMEAIARARNIQTIVAEYVGGRIPDLADFTVIGLARNDVLTITLFENETQRTRSTISIDLTSQPLHETVGEIARGVVREFNGELPIKPSIIPDALFLRYLSLKGQFASSPSITDKVEIAGNLEALLKSTPRFAEGMAELCRGYLSIYTHSGDTDLFSKAEQMCNRAWRLDDSNPWTNLAMGSLYRAAGQLDDAAESFQKALGTSRYLTSALSGLAKVSAAQGNTPRAIQLLEEAQAYEPNNWSLYADLAAVYFKRGMFNDAAMEYERAIALSKDSALLRSDLGSSYFMQEKFALAIENWEASNAIESNYAALSNLGSAYYYEGKFDQAVDVYEKAIAINDQDYRMWMNAGEAAFYSETVDSTPFYAKAVELALPQWEINPDALEVRSAIALSYASIGKIDAASEHIRVIESANNVDIYALYDLAVTYSRLGMAVEVSQTIDRLVAQGYPQSLVGKDANFR